MGRVLGPRTLVVQARAHLPKMAAPYTVILGSTSHLDLSLLCKYDTPIADMLARSPPLPLTIDYGDEHRVVTADDEQPILLALEHRDRVRRLHLLMSEETLQSIATASRGHGR
jgi:hypothetical protein